MLLINYILVYSSLFLTRRSLFALTGLSTNIQYDNQQNRFKSPLLMFCKNNEKNTKNYKNDEFNYFNDKNYLNDINYFNEINEMNNYNDFLNSHKKNVNTENIENTETKTIIHVDDKVDKFNNYNIYFYGQVTPESCFYLQQQLTTITNKIYANKLLNPENVNNLQGSNVRGSNVRGISNPSPVINLHLQSMGGSLLPTFGLIDFIKSSEVPIYTYVNGFVASAGSLISVSGHKRFMTKNSMILIHSLRTTIGEVNYNELKDNYENSRNMMNTLKNIYKEKSIINDKELDYLLEHDFWLNSSQCLKYNFVDYIIK